MELTKNLKLKKPAQEDFYNVDDFNANADTLDNEVQNIKNSYVPLKGDYIKNLSVNGDTVTYVKGNGTAGSFKTKTYSKLSEFTNDTGYITKNGTCAGATNDGNGRNIVNTYATKAENSATLTSAKNYTDTEKAKYLPLAGGRMSGYIYRNVDNDAMMVTGGSAVGNGASLCLQGKSHTSKGGFFIRANDGSTSIDFKGTPNGDLVWHGKNIVRSVNGVSADINGNVSIATSNVKTVDGVAPDANGNVLRRGCIVGQISNSAPNPWYKFASIILSQPYFDAHISFMVHRLYNGTFEMGVLNAHARAGSDVTREQSSLIWEYASSGIDLSKFVIATSAGNPLIVELWIKIDEPYVHYSFDVLSESSREKRYDDWTLYNTQTIGSQASITSGYTQIASTLSTLKNSIAGSSASCTGNSATATNARNDGNGANISSTYVKLATAQAISAQHNFSAGVKVNGYAITVG